jgi:Flp pilus assembly protein TadG
MPIFKAIRKIRLSLQPPQTMLSAASKVAALARALVSSLVTPSGRQVLSHCEVERRICFADLLQPDGSAILEFAITVPLLVVFVVGIYDFGAAYNQKQKIEQAAQEGAIIAAAQPTSDIDTTSVNPATLQPVVAAVFNSLANSGVLALANQGTCSLNPAPSGTATTGALTWTYSIAGCSEYPAGTVNGCMSTTANNLWIVINRGWVPSGGNSPSPVGTTVTVSYNYIWRFNSAIQLLLPGAKYSATTCLSESSTVHNQV